MTTKPKEWRVIPTSKRDTLFFESAVSLARLSDNKFRVGAMLVKNGNVIAGAFNYVRNIPGNVDLGDIGIHAEEAVVSMCSQTAVSGSTIYVARINRAGITVNSHPCERRCWPYLQVATVKHVVYHWNGRLIKERL
jgi:deoxycytidylate deaminase